MSVSDQYLFRGGISQGIPKLKGLALSVGIRGEGVPVHDLLGSSNGFRRPGEIISLDPGLIFHCKHDSFFVNGPWALYRNRPPSVPEIQNNTTNGDAFFADYTVIARFRTTFRKNGTVPEQQRPGALMLPGAAFCGGRGAGENISPKNIQPNG